MLIERRCINYKVHDESTSGRNHAPSVCGSGNTGPSFSRMRGITSRPFRSIAIILGLVEVFGVSIRCGWLRKLGRVLSSE